MDFSSIMKTLMSSDSVSQLSSLTGTQENQVSNILQSALPQLLSGAKQQATSADTAAGFAKALQSHGQVDADDLASFMGGVDMEDGQKIINHLLGKEAAAKEAADLSAKSGVSAANVSGILSAAAPLLMTLMGKQAAKSQPQQTAANAGGFDLSGIVGSLFGGGGDDDGFGLDDVLKGLFK